MPGAEFIHGRVARFLMHRYTRIPRAQEPAPDDFDEWGQPVAAEGVNAPAPIPDRPCLFLARGFGAYTIGPGGNYALNPSGPMQTDSPTLIVPWDDPLEVGDRIQNCYDPKTGHVYQLEAQVEREVDGPGQKGPPIYKTYTLLDAEVV